MPRPGFEPGNHSKVSDLKSDALDQTLLPRRQADGISAALDRLFRVPPVSTTYSSHLINLDTLSKNDGRDHLHLFVERRAQIPPPDINHPTIFVERHLVDHRIPRVARRFTSIVLEYVGNAPVAAVQVVVRIRLVRDVDAYLVTYREPVHLPPRAQS